MSFLECRFNACGVSVLPGTASIERELGSNPISILVFISVGSFLPRVTTAVNIHTSLVPRPLPDFILQLWRKIGHGCEIKSGSGLGTRLYPHSLHQIVLFQLQASSRCVSPLLLTSRPSILLMNRPESSLLWKRLSYTLTHSF